MTSSVWAYSPHVSTGKAVVMKVFGRRRGEPDEMLRMVEIKQGQFVGHNPVAPLLVYDSQYLVIEEVDADPAP